MLCKASVTVTANKTKGNIRGEKIEEPEATWLFSSRAQKVSVLSDRCLDVVVSHIGLQTRESPSTSSAFYHP